jgi:hypothetical protein
VENIDKPTYPSQRRNLFLISGALVLALHTNLTTDHINLLVAQLDLNGPQSVATFLWWLWGYWFVRFIQAFIELGANRGIKAVYENKRTELYARKGYRKLLREKRPSLDLSNSPNDTLLKVGHGFEVTRGARVDVTYTITRTQFVDDRGAGGKQLPPEAITLRGKDLIGPKVGAFLWTAFCTTRGTEYLLPFLVGIAPLVYWQFGQGSELDLLNSW